MCGKWEEMKIERRKDVIVGKGIDEVFCFN